MGFGRPKTRSANGADQPPTQPRFNLVISVIFEHGDRVQLVDRLDRYVLDHANKR